MTVINAMTFTKLHTQAEAALAAAAATEDDAARQSLAALGQGYATLAGATATWLQSTSSS